MIIMKNSLKYILLTFIAICSFGCESFLDKVPLDFVSPETYYSNETELNTALIGVYDVLSSRSYYGQAIMLHFESCTDESYLNRTSTKTGISVNNFTYTDPFLNNFWFAFYEGIERANVLISKIHKADIDEVKRENILAQALFLRSYYYFVLASNFGDIPLKLVPTGSADNIYIPRTPVKVIFEQVLADMKKAEPNLKKISEYKHPSFVSQTACQGIIARVCLKMAGYPLLDKSKYSEAITYALKVKDSGEHQLTTKYNTKLTNSAYSQIFINHTQDVYDISEGIWEAEYSGNLLNSADFEVEGFAVMQGVQFTVLGIDSIGYSYGQQNTTRRFFERFDNQDKRRDWSIGGYRYMMLPPYPRIYWAENVIIQRNIAKWRRNYEKFSPKQKNFGPTNFPLLRYADVLLMLAEAENEVNGPTDIAYNALNQVRRRGYGLDVNIVNSISDAPTGMGKEQFRNFIQEERSRELNHEGLRKFDLIRWGIYIQRMHDMIPEVQTYNGGFAACVIGYESVSERNLLLPIPSGEMTVNRAIIENNPGW